MSPTSSFPRGRPRRFGEVVLLSLVLSLASLAGSWLLAYAVVDTAGRRSTTGPPDILITVALALLAAWAGISIASVMGLDGRGWAVALNKSALVSLGFTLLTAGFGIGTALVNAAIGFPALLVAAFLVGRWRGRHAEAPPPLTDEPKARLPRFAYIAAALTLVGLAFNTGGIATASTSALPAAAAPTATTNPCVTAPHDTFNISAINVDITLNKYGVHDPNSFMYVLNSNISAVRAQEASGQVSTGLGDDAIQPLVIRAREGDCVTVNLTNATTFGVQAMDQPPEPDPADGCNNGALPPLNAAGQCDGTLARTAPENISWNADGLPGLSAADVSSAVGNNPGNTAAAGQAKSYTVYMDPALGEGAHVFHSTGDDHELQAHGLFGAIISERPGRSGWTRTRITSRCRAAGTRRSRCRRARASASSRCSSTRSATKGTGRSTRSPVPPATPPSTKSSRALGSPRPDASFPWWTTSPTPTAPAARPSTTAVSVSSSGSSARRTPASSPTRPRTTARTLTATWPRRSRTSMWATPTRSA